MAQSKTAKILSIEEQITALEKKKKEYLQEQKEIDRKARNHRLCKRGGYVEKYLPDIIDFTEEQFEIFVKKVLLTPFTTRAINEIKAQAETINTEPQNGSAAVQNGEAASPKGEETARRAS